MLLIKPCPDVLRFVPCAETLLRRVEAHSDAPAGCRPRRTESSTRQGRPRLRHDDNVDDLIAFLNARLDEDESGAKALASKPWKAEPVVYGRPEDGWGEPNTWEIETVDGQTIVHHQTHEGGGIYEEEVAAHIARHDPARVLREVAAKRAILAVHVPERRRVWIQNEDGGTNFGDLVCVTCYRPQVNEGTNPWWPCTTVRILAAVYADYRDEWRL